MVVGADITVDSLVPAYGRPGGRGRGQADECRVNLVGEVSLGIADDFGIALFDAPHPGVISCCWCICIIKWRGHDFSLGVFCAATVIAYVVAVVVRISR
jgi:hypothetical protein